jgi:hypothetical protein
MGENKQQVYDSKIIFQGGMQTLKLDVYYLLTTSSHIVATKQKNSLHFFSYFSGREL